MRTAKIGPDLRLGYNGGRSAKTFYCRSYLSNPTSSPLPPPPRSISAVSRVRSLIFPEQRLVIEPIATSVFHFSQAIAFGVAVKRNSSSRDISKTQTIKFPRGKLPWEKGKLSTSRVYLGKKSVV